MKGLQDRMKEGVDFTLVDVREAWEREAFHIGGIHIPLSEWYLKRERWVGLSGTIVLYCEKGIRSAIAGQRLEAEGIGPVYNLTGGMKAWKEAFGTDRRAPTNGSNP